MPWRWRIVVGGSCNGHVLLFWTLSAFSLLACLARLDVVNGRMVVNDGRVCRYSGRGQALVTPSAYYALTHATTTTHGGLSIALPSRAVSTDDVGGTAGTAL